MRRGVCHGELAEAFRGPYETARSIIEDVLAFAGPGTDCRDIFRRAEAMAREAGLGDFFMGHGEGKVAFIGHGLGLEINELPIVTPRHERILQEGMVFAFEPKFVLPGLGAVGIEIDLIVGPGGVERVTTGSFDLVCL
jgi:Xaa-Pro aminopeptidase